MWLLICSFYSIFKLFYESDGDISKYYRPFNEFFNHLIEFPIADKINTTTAIFAAVAYPYG